MATLPGIQIAIGLDDERFARGIRSADRQMTQFAQTAQRSNAAIRAAFQQVSFQVQDFVVQVFSGTNAMRAFAQQAPQMPSAFGPQGAAIGTIVAIVAG